VHKIPNFEFFGFLGRLKKEGSWWTNLRIFLFVMCEWDVLYMLIPKEKKKHFNQTVLLSSLSFWRLNLRCVVFSRATLLWRCMHFLFYKHVHWQPVRLMMKLFDLENELETLALGCDCDCKSHPVDPIPQFQLEPWPWFCMDHPNVGDCIVFKVSAEVHPRGTSADIVYSSSCKCIF